MYCRRFQTDTPTHSLWFSARGLHGLACRRSGPRHQRHSQLNDILWRAFETAHVPAVKEPAGLSRDDGKRPDGVTLLPWAQGFIARDVTVPVMHTTV